jgi:hypothetical protein
MFGVLAYQEMKTRETFENMRDTAQGHIRRIHRNIRNGTANVSSNVSYNVRKQRRQLGF